MLPFIRFFRFAFAAVLLAACAPTSPKPTVSTVLVAPASATISVGQWVRIVATVSTNPGGSAYSVTWTSSAAAAATVDSTGLVAGVSASPGVSICAIASAGDLGSGVRSCATVVVSPAPICPGPTGALIPAADTMHVGDKVQFQIPAAQLAGRGANEIHWTVDVPATATIDSLTGFVTAVSVGSTDVIATDPLLSSPCPHEWQARAIVH